MKTSSMIPSPYSRRSQLFALLLLPTLFAIILTQNNKNIARAEHLLTDLTKNYAEPCRSLAKDSLRSFRITKRSNDILDASHAYQAAGCSVDALLDIDKRFLESLSP